MNNGTSVIHCTLLLISGWNLVCFVLSLLKYLPQNCSITMCLNLTVVFVLHSGVCHLPELLSLSAVWRQAWLFVPPPALQEPLPQTGLLLRLCLWLEHAQICKLYCRIEGIHLIICHVQSQSPHEYCFHRWLALIDCIQRPVSIQSIPSTNSHSCEFKLVKLISSQNSWELEDAYFEFPTSTSTQL